MEFSITPETLQNVREVRRARPRPVCARLRVSRLSLCSRGAPYPASSSGVTWTPPAAPSHDPDRRTAAGEFRGHHQEHRAAAGAGGDLRWVRHTHTALSTLSLSIVCLYTHTHRSVYTLSLTHTHTRSLTGLSTHTHTQVCLHSLSLSDTRSLTGLSTHTHTGVTLLSVLRLRGGIRSRRHRDPEHPDR